MKKEHKELYQKIRDNQKYCRLCGNSGWTEVHHIIFGSLHGTRDSLTYEDNLILLCKNCHLLVHSNKKKYTPILQDIRKEIK